MKKWHYVNGALVAVVGFICLVGDFESSVCLGWIAFIVSMDFAWKLKDRGDRE